MWHVGHVSDPYNQGDDEGELVVTGLPDDLQGPPPEEAATSGPDEPDGDLDDEDNDVVEPVADDGDDNDAEDDLDDDVDDEDVDDLEAIDGVDEEVAYTLEEFDDEQLDQLFDALDEAVIPYLWDGDELFIQAADEQAVDELLERIANPHEIAAEDADGDGGGWLLGELFVTADRLQRDPEEHETVASMLQLATASDEAAPPYGLAEPEWDQLRERVTALATILEQDDPDPDGAIEAARELRNAVRPYV
jgi:hypothetical protein